MVVPAPPRPLPNLNPLPSQLPSGPPAPLLPPPVRTYVPNAVPQVNPVFGQTASPNYGALTALTWDAEQKESTPTPSQQYANFTFWFTNTSSSEVVINAVRTSCGCTLARLPATPWPVKPGTNGPIEVALDLRGKMGVISKSITVESSAGMKSLIIKVTLPTPGQAPVVTALPPQHPPMADGDRLANMQKALADRQVVFKDAACAKCHAEPARNVADGHALYRGVCAVCHDSPLRAAMVTDLKAIRHETDLDYWRHWIRNGKPGSMMPSFAQSAGEGGPLTDAQVEALAAYCQKAFPPLRGTPGGLTPVPTANTSSKTPSNGVFTPISILPVPPRQN